MVFLCSTSGTRRAYGTLFGFLFETIGELFSRSFARLSLISMARFSKRNSSGIRVSGIYPSLPFAIANNPTPGGDHPRTKQASRYIDQLQGAALVIELTKIDDEGIGISNGDCGLSAPADEKRIWRAARTDTIVARDLHDDNA